MGERGGRTRGANTKLMPDPLCWRHSKHKIWRRIYYYILLYSKGHSSSYCIRFLIFTSSSFLSCKDDGSLVLSSEIGNSIELYPSIFNSALYSSSFRIESQQLFCQYASTVMALCFRTLHRSGSESELRCRSYKNLREKKLYRKEYLTWPGLRCPVTRELLCAAAVPPIPPPLFATQPAQSIIRIYDAHNEQRNMRQLRDGVEL